MCVQEHHFLINYFPFYRNNQFTDADVIVQSDSLMEAGSNTMVNIIVNEPGQNNAVPGNVVEDALHQTIQEDNSTVLTNLALAIVNTPTVSVAERENALSVILPNTTVNEVSVENITDSLKFVSCSVQYFQWRCQSMLIK